MPPSQDFPRPHWLSLLALSSAVRLAGLAEGHGDLLACTDIRTPEIGLILLRGRMGGDGADFPFAEALVCHCQVQSPQGHRGMAWILGDDLAHGRWVARWDACLQDRDFYQQWGASALLTLAQEQLSADQDRSIAAADTRVNFANLETMRSDSIAPANGRRGRSNV